MKNQTKTRRKNSAAKCPSCNENIYVSRHARLGSRVTCSNCDINYVITDFDPVEVDWSSDYDELFDDDYYD
jgi:hypothetical protein